jgi:excisionase family DNA binding protein
MLPTPSHGQMEIIPFETAPTSTARQHDEPLLLRVSEAALLLTISERHLYDLLRSGEIPAIRLGRCVRVSRAALLRYINQEEDRGTTEAPRRCGQFFS